MPLLTHEQHVAILDAVKQFRATAELRHLSAACKLTPQKVREIRQSSLSQAELAELYHVNQTTISMVLRRRRWKDVT